LRSTFFAILIFQSFIGTGQIFDTTHYKRDLSYFITSASTEDLAFDVVREDTILGFTHRLFNESINVHPGLHLGRIASPFKSLVPILPNTNVFVLSNPLFRPYGYQKDSTLYYDSKTARTRLKYSQGSGNLLFLKAEHSQNITKNWSFGIDYTRAKSHNLYFNNLPLFNLERISNMFSTNLYSHFVTKNRRYEIFTNFINNKNTIKETFGLGNRVSFDTLVGRGKLYSAQAQLSDAQNLFINRSFSFQQFFRDGDRTIQVDDTTVVDDTTTANISKHWFHSFEYKRNINRFIDNNPDTLFEERFISLETLDSIFYSVIQNRIGRVARTNRSVLKYWILHEAITVKQLHAHQSRLQHLQLGASGQLDSKPGILFAELKYAPIGYYSGDYALRAKLTTEKKRSKWQLIANVIKHRPNYNDQFFGSNYYYWHNRLNKTDIIDIQSVLSVTKTAFQIGGTWRQYQNFVYYDTTGLPNQMQSGITYASGFVSNHFHIGRSIHFKHRFTFQYSSNKVMPVPDILYKASLYKEGFLFNKNMWARVGFDLTYFSEFKGYGYNPAIRQFTLSKNTVGGYPLVDFFINTQVNSMLLFVSVQHFTQGYFINDSFSAENYPIIGRALRFGVDWRLFD